MCMTIAVLLRRVPYFVSCFAITVNASHAVLSSHVLRWLFPLCVIVCDVFVSRVAIACRIHSNLARLQSSPRVKCFVFIRLAWRNVRVFPRTLRACYSRHVELW